MAADAFDGGVLVVTGAGSGIGEALVRRGAARGMRVIAADINGNRIAAVVADLRLSGAEASAHEVNVCDHVAMERLAGEVFDRHGGVRMLFNNAGVESSGLLWETAPATFRRLIEVNVLGVFHGIRAFLPLMLHQPGLGSVVNVSSIGAFTVAPIGAPYFASKHAVQALTESLHLEVELVGAPLTVHVLNPGPVDTRIFVDASVEETPAPRRTPGNGSYIHDHGMPPAHVAEIAFESVARGDFWNVTHPAMQEHAARERARSIASA